MKDIIIIIIIISNQSTHNISLKAIRGGSSDGVKLVR
jgi:hypothetical protein